jgi:hypothetical protein
MTNAYLEELQNIILFFNITYYWIVSKLIRAHYKNIFILFSSIVIVFRMFVIDNKKVRYVQPSSHNQNLLN